VVYAALADFLAISIKELVERDFGLSNGRPRALFFHAIVLIYQLKKIKNVKNLFK